MVEIYNPSEAGVTTINGLDGDVVLVAGSGISLTPVGNNITITNTGGGGSSTPQSYTNTYTGNKITRRDFADGSYILYSYTGNQLNYRENGRGQRRTFNWVGNQILTTTVT